MSRNDKPKAGAAEVGDALVASLGFEPTKAAKSDVSDSGAPTDDLQDPMGEIESSNGSSKNGSDSGSGPESGSKTDKVLGNQVDDPVLDEPKQAASNGKGGQHSGQRPNRKKRSRRGKSSPGSARGSSKSTKATNSPSNGSEANGSNSTDSKKSPSMTDVADPTIDDDKVVPDKQPIKAVVSEKAESVVAAGLDDGLKAKVGSKKQATVPATTGEVPVVKIDEAPEPEAGVAAEPEAKGGDGDGGKARPVAEQASVTAAIGSAPERPSAKQRQASAKAKSTPAAKPGSKPAAAKAKTAAKTAARAEAPPADVPDLDVPDLDVETESPKRLVAEPKPKPAPARRVAVADEGDRPTVWQEFFGSPFGRGRKMQARKVRRVIRHVDPWSVLTFSVLFHMCVFAALLLASVLVWNVAESAGTIEKVEDFILELGDYETFTIDGEVIFRAGVAIAGILTLASSVIVVLLAVMFNLLSDLIGGIRVTVIEEETVRYETTSGGE